MTYPLHTGDRTATVGAEWRVWDRRCRLVVTDPWALYFAREVLERRLAVADRFVNPRRAGSVVRRMLREGGWPGSTRPHGPFGPEPTIADPTGIGPFPYGLTTAPDGAPVHVTAEKTVERTVRRDRDVLRIGPGASAYAWTAQRCAEAVAETTSCGVLVAIGDDVATSGLAPVGGWRLELADDNHHVDDPSAARSTVLALDGGAISRVSAVRTTRHHGRGADLKRIVVPATGRSITPVWRTVTVAAANGPAASAACHGAVLRGPWAPGWLAGLGVAAVLVTASGEDRVVIGRWPLAD